MMCYDQEWFRYLWVAIAGLVLYAFGIPASILWMLRAAREQHFRLMLEAKRETRKRHVDLVHRTVSEHIHRKNSWKSSGRSIADASVGNNPSIRRMSRSIMKH